VTWANRAACRGTPDTIWFPRKGNNATTAYTAARWYCDRCPVRLQCLDEALSVEVPGLRFGMRAGLNPDQRDDIARGHAPMPVFPAPLPLPAPRPEGVLVMPDTAPEPPSRPGPQLVPPAAPAPDPSASAEALIAWGTAHASSRVQSLAGKTRGALADLRQAYERESKVAAAEARVARLKAHLENAQRDLAAARGGKAKPAGAAPAPRSEDYPAIRAWAREQGIEVPVRGIPKREIREAYYAAQRAA
jgi:hypothetical protein